MSSNLLDAAENAFKFCAQSKDLQQSFLYTRMTVDRVSDALQWLMVQSGLSDHVKKKILVARSSPFWGEENAETKEGAKDEFYFPFQVNIRKQFLEIDGKLLRLEEGSESADRTRMSIVKFDSQEDAMNGCLTDICYRYRRWEYHPPFNDKEGMTALITALDGYPLAEELQSIYQRMHLSEATPGAREGLKVKRL